VTTTQTQSHGQRFIALLKLRDFRQLLWTRFAAQWGDGIFQAGLAGAVLFNPERQANALAIAGGFTVLLLPYSIVGPFAGALLDRWDRRKVLLVANLMRMLFIVATAITVDIGNSGLLFYAFALCTIAISRFVGSGLSAALPHVVPENELVKANATSTTIGAAITVFGAGCAFGLRAAVGSGNHGSALVTTSAIAGSFLSALFVSRFITGALGPDDVNEPRQTIVAILHGLRDGARAARHAPTVLAGFAALFAHRAAYAVSLLMTVLLLRFGLVHHHHGFLRGGVGGLGEVAGAGALGIVLAGLITTSVVRRFGRRRAILGSLAIAGLAELILGLMMSVPSIIAASFFITCAGQIIKLCVDSAVQHDIEDDNRGRVFALYDTLFNVTQVVAVSIAATVIAPDGRSPLLVVAAFLLYAVGFAFFYRIEAKH
jgi:MFS family permease